MQHHIGITVPNLASAIERYTQFMGGNLVGQIECVSIGKNLAFIHLPLENTMIELIEVPDQIGEEFLDHVAFTNMPFKAIKNYQSSTDIPELGATVVFYNTTGSYQKNLEAIQFTDPSLDPWYLVNVDRKPE